MQGFADDVVDLGFGLRHLQCLLDLGFIDVPEGHLAASTFPAAGPETGDDRDGDQGQHHDGRAGQEEPDGERDVLGCRGRLLFRDAL